MYKKHFLDGEEILWEYSECKNEKASERSIVIFGAIAIILIILAYLDILYSMLEYILLNFGILFIIISALSGMSFFMLIKKILTHIYLPFKKCNVSFNDLENYKTKYIITNYHVIIKNFYQTALITSSSALKNLINHKIKKENDWVILDLDLFEDVKVEDENRQISFQVKNKWPSGLYFYFDKDTLGKFEEPLRILQNLLKKIKRNKETPANEQEKIHMPFIDDIVDYIYRTPFSFYTLGRIALGILIYLILSCFISTPAFLAYVNYNDISPTYFISASVWTLFFTILIEMVLPFIEKRVLSYLKPQLKLRFKTDPTYPRNMIYSDFLFSAVASFIMMVLQVAMMTIQVVMISDSTISFIWFYLVGGLIFFMIMTFYFKKYKSSTQTKKEGEKQNK